MEEQWKWIKGLEGKYKISNFGRVKSFHGCNCGRLVSIKNSKGWYLSRRFYDGKKWHSIRIHRCVYETFVGEIPKGYHIHHIDEDKQNNNVNNLKLMNASDHLKISAHKPSTYAAMVYRNRFCQKHILQYTLDGIFIREFINATEAGKATGVCTRNIIQVANKDPFNETTGACRKQAGGFIWKYKEKGVV